MESARTRLEEDEFPLAFQKTQEGIDPDNPNALSLGSAVEKQRTQNQTENWLRLMDQHIHNGSFEQARQVLEEILKLNPNHGKARELLAGLDQREKEVERSIPRALAAVGGVWRRFKLNLSAAILRKETLLRYPGAKLLADQTASAEVAKTRSEVLSDPVLFALGKETQSKPAGLHGQTDAATVRLDLVERQPGFTETGGPERLVHSEPQPIAPDEFTLVFQDPQHTARLHRGTGERIDPGTLARAQARELIEIIQLRDFESAVALRGKWLPGIEGAGGELMGFSEAARYLGAAQDAVSPHVRIEHLKRAQQVIISIGNQLLPGDSPLSRHLP